MPADATGWLRFQQRLVAYARHRRLPRSGLFKNRAELYVPTQLALLVVSLLAANSALWPAAVFLATTILLDAVAYNAMVAFVTQRPQVPLRSVMFALLTFVQFGLAFSVFYRTLPSDQFMPSLGAVSAFYFSVVTMATVGYGDILPTGPASRILVVGQIALGVFFLATIVSTIASWANGSPDLPTLNELESRASSR